MGYEELIENRKKGNCTDVPMREAAEKLQAAVYNLRERIETVEQLSDMYMCLIGTDKEAPWVRTMMSINGQARQGLIETEQEGFPRPPQGTGRR